MSEWKTWPGFSRYEASRRGLIRNAGTGLVMSTNPNNNGYMRLNLTGDDGKPHNVLVHRAVLLAHAGPPGDGQEACHGRGGNQDNRYPENLRWGTKAENNGTDKAEFGTPASPNPTYPCKDGCGALVIHENRRCVECVARVGREAAAMLARGVNLHDVADAYGYSGPDWVWKLAVDHGGCTLTKREALSQHPSLSQRVTGRLAVTLRARRRPVTHRD